MANQITKQQADFCARTGARFLGTGRADLYSLNSDETTVFATNNLRTSGGVVDWFAIQVADPSDMRAEAKKCSLAAWHAYGSLSASAISPMVEDKLSKSINRHMASADGDQIDEIIERTEYAADGVAVGSGAARDQMLYRAALRQLGKLMGHA